MGKPSKKANDQVAVSPVSVPEKKSAKKGKREAKESLEKVISAKKQKVEVETKKVKAPPPKKEEEPSSSEEDELSESEEEEPVATKKTNGTKAAVQKKMESNDDSDSADEDDEEDESSDEESLQKQTKAPASGVTKEESSEEEEDESSDEEEPKKAEQKKSGAKDDSDSEEDESEDEEESEDEKPTKTPKKDVVMKDAPAGKAKSDKKEPKTPVGNQNESGTTTIFVGNLPFKADEDEIASFFSEAGEVVQVRLATNEEGRPRGFGHVEFATEEAAKKALEMNQQEFMGRELRLDLANSRGSSTPHTKDNSSNQKGGKTAFVKGFDTSLGEDEIRTKLQEHFDSCGEVTRVSIPTDRETGAIRGIAYMDFKDGGAFAKASELNGSELDGCVLTVDEAQPRGDGGGRSGGRSGGRGGRFSGGRGGRGGDFGGRGGGGRGRGGRGGGRGRGRKSFGDY